MENLVIYRIRSMATGLPVYSPASHNGVIAFDHLAGPLPVPVVMTLLRYIRGPLFSHCGSVEGCGGNPDAVVIACVGFGNCGDSCNKCGAYKYFTCCGALGHDMWGQDGEDDGDNDCFADSEEQAESNAAICGITMASRAPELQYPSYHRGPRE